MPNSSNRLRVWLMQAVRADKMRSSMRCRTSTACCCSVFTGTNAGCSISRVRKISDGGKDKWFKFSTGKGFDWAGISDNSNSAKQFVSYTTTLDNIFESDAVLTLKCRSTWKSGSIAVGQIEINN
ncbi:hypothetical protein PSECIP111951_00205 [Pseudoalteromonas holothuriae]|uniref:Uncharacterized protein n=1 Tax=Pseudoalteromonas holothuriae TaxID=2963714 RepID=A0ABM9GDJ4_9GAMM|nr:hypothetical protein PSECIP111951_00205 [Pseudoalteromonas sp. CIP111951]